MRWEIIDLPEIIDDRASKEVKDRLEQLRKQRDEVDAFRAKHDNEVVRRSSWTSAERVRAACEQGGVDVRMLRLECYEKEIALRSSVIDFLLTLYKKDAIRVSDEIYAEKAEFDKALRAKLVKLGYRDTGNPPTDAHSITPGMIMIHPKMRELIDLHRDSQSHYDGESRAARHANLIKEAQRSMDAFAEQVANGA